MYLDDGWVCGDFKTCKSASDLIQEILQKSGFVLNSEKSVLEPTKIIVLLGFLWNMESSTLKVPVEKIKDIKDILKNLLDNKSSISARRLSSIVGKIIALKPSFGNICQLMTRHLSITICGKESWDSVLYLDSENIQELKFWLENINSISFKYFTCVENICLKR